MLYNYFVSLYGTTRLLLFYLTIFLYILISKSQLSTLPDYEEVAGSTSGFSHSVAAPTALSEFHRSLQAQKGSKPLL